MNKLSSRFLKHLTYDIIHKPWGQAKGVYQVSNPQWVLSWESAYIAQYLAERGIRVQQTEKVEHLRGQVIHFYDRYMYLMQHKYWDLHPSNAVFLTWFHGDLDDPNPDMQQLFGLLPARLPHLAGITTSCQLTRQTLLKLGVPDEKIHIIPITIDIQTFQPPTPAQRQAARARYGIPEGAVCVGSFQKDGQGWGDGMEAKRVKGPDIFLGAIAQLAQRQPHIFVFLTGPARGYVKHGLDQLGIPYVHHYLDDYLQIASCYHALDLYIISSRSEGGPKAMMEAWASGVPLVSTCMGMPADWMEMGKNGMLAEVEDADGLAESAHRLLEDADLRATCIQGGLETVQTLDWRAIGKLYLQLYQPYL